MTIRHLTGRGAAATVAVGLASAAGGVALLAEAARGAQGWGFLLLAGVAGLAAGAVVGALPWRLTTALDDEGLALGWALGRIRIPWEAVRRVVIGPLGSGGERDPVTVTLFLRSGADVLFATLGRKRPEDHPACAPLLKEARRRGIAVDDTLAPPEERKRREQAWRKARLKGWR